MSNPPKKENPFVSLGFNILAPVLILQKLTAQIGPVQALLLALAFPLGYGAYDYFTNHRKNWISLLGLVNTLFTGGFALMKLSGFWFAVKEASFPLLLGVAVLVSIRLKSPAMKKLFFNDTVFNVELINQRAIAKDKKTSLDKIFVSSTYLLSVSFFLSSLLNFLLASYVFFELPDDLVGDARVAALNDQIAQMTWMSFVVIVLPLMLFMGYIFYHLISNLKVITGLSTEEMLNAK